MKFEIHDNPFEAFKFRLPGCVHLVNVGGQGGHLSDKRSRLFAGATRFSFFHEHLQFIPRFATLSLTFLSVLSRSMAGSLLVEACVPHPQAVKRRRFPEGFSSTAEKGFTQPFGGPARGDINNPRIHKN